MKETLRLLLNLSKAESKNAITALKRMKKKGEKEEKKRKKKKNTTETDDPTWVVAIRTLSEALDSGGAVIQRRPQPVDSSWKEQKH